MKNETVKTISIYMQGKCKPVWIFDVSDKTAEKIMLDYTSTLQVLTIDNVPTKSGTMSLNINKKYITHVTVE